MHLKPAEYIISVFGGVRKRPKLLEEVLRLFLNGKSQEGKRVVEVAFLARFNDKYSILRTFLDWMLHPKI